MAALAGLSQPALAAEAGPQGSDSNRALTVVYPQIRQPFLKVYETIARGATKGFSGKASELVLAKDQSRDQLQNQLADKMVIVLGSRGVSQLRGIGLQRPLVVGAVSEQLSGVYGLSMIPDAGVVASKLQVLAPTTLRVFVVARADKNIADLAAAQIAFNQIDVQLFIKEATDIRDAANIYRKLTAELKVGDAVWILPGDRFVNNPLLSILLQAAWRSDFVVFSSNPTHVNRGALFSVYPDNYQMGVRLGEIARQVAEGSQAPVQMEPLRSVFVTVNERTSNHLGITITDDMKEHVDLILPAR